MTIGRKNIRTAHLWVLYLLFCYYTTGCAIKDDQFTLGRVERLLEQFEAVEAAQDSGVSQESLMIQLAQADEQLIDHLHVHPNDVEALIVSVRMGRFRHVAEPIVLTPGQEPPDSDSTLAPLQANLDRALALEPNNAEAHYWKARLYGLRNPVVLEGRIYYVPADLDQAIRFARKSVKLAPTNVLYREALALYLVEGQKPKEAIDVIQLVADKHHPIYLLLNDLESLPIPKIATLSKVDSESFSQQQMARGRIQNYPQLRVRFYILPMSIAKLEEFYSNHWSGFRFFEKIDPQVAGDGEIHFFEQHLKEKRNIFVPATTGTEIPEEPSDGISLSVIELRNLPAEMRRQTPAGFDLPANVGEVFCYLVVRNFRAIK